MPSLVRLPQRKQPVKSRNRYRWTNDRVTCQACWAAGFRRPVPACLWCQRRKEIRRQKKDSR